MSILIQEGYYKQVIYKDTIELNDLYIGMRNDDLVY